MSFGFSTVGASTFGSAAPPPTSTPGFGFGQPKPGVSLFGGVSSSMPTSTPSLFGGVAAPTSNLFATPAKPPLFTTPAPAFGQTQSGGLFGAQTMQQPQQQLQFQQQQQQQQLQQQQQNANLFSNTFNTSSLGNTIGMTTMAKPGQPPVLDQLSTVAKQWDRIDPSCAFKHYFYNLVPPSEVALYACPPNEDPRLYAQAVASNPDPSCLVPALATGVEDLEKRLQTQHETTTQHQSKLAEINSKISNLDREHNLKNTVKVAELKRRYMVICARVIRLMRCLWVLKRLGCGTSEAEVVVKNKLDQLNNLLKKPSTLHGKLTELVARVQQIKEMGQLRELGGGDRRTGGMTGDLDMSEDVEAKVFEALMMHTKELSVLVKTLQEDNKTLEELGALV